MNDFLCVYCGRETFSFNSLHIDMSNKMIHEWCYAKWKEEKHQRDKQEYEN